MSSLPSYSLIHAEVTRREATQGVWVPAGFSYCRTNPERTLGGTRHDDKKIQKNLVEKIMDLLGDDAYLYAHGEGRSVKELKKAWEAACELCNHKIPYRTVYEWFQHYLHFGETKAETRRRMRSSKRRTGMRVTKATSFSDADSAALEDIVQNKPHLYLDEIQLVMRRTRGKVWHTSTLWRQIRRLGHTLQDLVVRARQRSETERELFRHRYSTFVDNPNQAIFIDETHRSANASRRRRGWSKKGKPPVIDAFFEEDFRKRYTLIGAADINGFVVEACQIVEREHGKHDNDPTRGTVDMERFEEYVEEYLVPMLGSFGRGEPRSVVIMDNASIHISLRVQELIENAGAKLIYTAPYSPDLNPIEFFFSVYKAGLKRYTYMEYINWEQAHLLSLAEVTPVKARNFFRKAQVPGCEKLSQNDDFDDDLFVVTVVATAAVYAFRNGSMI